MIRRTLPGSGRPSTGLVATATTTLTVVLLATACSSGNDAAGTGTTESATTPPTTSSTTTTPSQTPSTSATAARTPYPTTTTAHAAPWTLKDADFGYVLSARWVSGGVEITFDRATWLLASQVPAWNKANPGHPVVAADDYAIGNLSSRKRTFLVRTGAKIFGSILLSDQPEPKRITASQLVSRMASAPVAVTCWLYHQYGGLNGEVVQLEEQYRP